MTTLYSKIYGSGDPVIILHGLFGMSDNWSTFAKRLAETHMVILIDVRDHGRSAHTANFNYEIAAEDIAHWCEENFIRRVSVIGHSMGGKIAMKLADGFPTLIERLVIVDIAPIDYKGGHELIIKTLNEAPISEAKSRKDIETFILKRIPDRGVVLFLMKNLSRKKEGGFRWKMNLSLLTEQYAEILKSPLIDVIDVPTLFVKGGKSSYILEAGERAIDDLFSEFSMVTVDDAGHWVHAEKPEILYKIIHDFLADL